MSNINPTNSQEFPGPHQQQEEKPTSVVTSFLLRRLPVQGDQILLVRRSQRVRTYQGAWAGISGYLEAGVTPLEQAYTELREELGVDASVLHLEKVGTPLPVEDTEGHHSWLVHPFLFTVADQAALRIDWEALEMRWVKPSDLASYSTVPKLTEALAEVYTIGPTNQAGDHGETL